MNLMNGQYSQHLVDQQICSKCNTIVGDGNKCSCKEKENCQHEKISYGRINKWFIIDCSDCGKILRIDDWDTQLRTLDEFKIECECGKETIITPIEKETCKWIHDDMNYFFPSCSIEFISTGEKLSTKKHEKDKFCAYCGKEIEDVD